MTFSIVEKYGILLHKSVDRGRHDMAKNVKTVKVDQSKVVSLDTGSGSLAYNRLDMQVSQTLHMAIELYDSLDYLFILDYYDDITLFDDKSNPKTVSYYQMKTHEESISISTAISEDWLSKLYAQFDRPDWFVKELGLITNCPLKVTVTTQGDDEKNHKSTTSYTSERTEFSKFNPVTIEKIKEDIAAKLGKDKKDIDLSKFVHMRTTISIPKHKDIVEQEMGDFLHKKYPRITIDVVKAIYGSMLEILTKRQGYELLDNEEEYGTVREKKGVTKEDFTRVIEEAMIISIPPFDEIRIVSALADSAKYEASFEYTKILSDSQVKSESFTNVFIQVRGLCLSHEKDTSETILAYANRLCNILYSRSCVIEPIYNRMYICVLIICILINEGRRVL